jgi:hypothetical protein
MCLFVIFAHCIVERGFLVWTDTFWQKITYIFTLGHPFRAYFSLKNWFFVVTIAKVQKFYSDLLES